MNKITITLILVAALLAGFLGGKIGAPAPSNSFGTATDCTSNTCLTSLSVLGTLGISGTMTHQTTGTTTNIEISTSATQGYCQQFNATSSNTLLNITYQATTSVMSQASAVSGVIRYGACN